MDIIEIIKGSFALLFLQSSWSYIGRQTLGILSIIILLTKNRTDTNEPNRKQLKERIWQKFSFNTNPYCTGIMLGIALNKQGEIFNESYFSLQHIFGSIGDEFFWHTFRPFLLSLAVLILLIGYYSTSNFYTIGIFKFAPLIFLVPYNIVAQGIRIHGLYEGKKYGKDAAVSLIEELRKPINGLYNSFAFVMGMLLTLLPMILIYNFYGKIITLSKSALIAMSLLLVVVLSFLVLRSERTSSYLLIGGLLIFLIIKVL